jgi:2-polyprenyl-3-methyl-5-hydroxy-6-metoxy-1,4-benzoquinol methylase
VGIAAVALRKWTDAKDVAICDFRDEVLGNMKKNCQTNDANGVNVFKINIEEMMKSAIQYDCVICPDLLTLGFHPQLIAALFSRLVRKGG